MIVVRGVFEAVSAVHRAHDVAPLHLPHLAAHATTNDSARTTWREPLWPRSSLLMGPTLEDHWKATRGGKKEVRSRKVFAATWFRSFESPRHNVGSELPHPKEFSSKQKVKISKSGKELAARATHVCVLAARGQNVGCLRLSALSP